MPHVLRALRALVLHMPCASRFVVPRVPRALCALVTYVLRPLTCSRALVPHVPCALRALVSNVPRVPRALVLHVPRILRGLRSSFLMCLVPCVLLCLTCLVP